MKRSVAIVLAVVLAAGAWPHLFALPLAPESRDAVVWITNGSVWEAGWARWVFWSNHFVGWRPLTALSYSLDSLVGGYAPWPYRLTDLASHIGCALAIYGVHRRLVPRLSAWGGVVAAAVFVLHPVTGLVVPHMARRAYSLASLFSLLGVYAMLSGRRRAAWEAAVLLGLGALGNEAAYVAIPAVALLVFLRSGDLRTAARTAMPSVNVAVALVALRFLVLHGMGGYGVEASTSSSIPWLASKGLLGLEAMRTGQTTVPDAFAAVALAAVVGGATLPQVRRDTDDATIATAFLFSWILGILLVYAPQGVFFPRQIYVPLVPWALLVGVAASGALASVGVRRVLLAGASGLGVVLAAWQSPVLRGPDPLLVAAWRAQDLLIRQMELDFRGLPDDAVVDAIVPYHLRPDAEALRARDAEDKDARFHGRQALTWVARVQGLKVGTVSSYLLDPRKPPPAVRIEGGPEGPQVVLPPGVEPYDLSGAKRVETGPAGTVIVPDRTPRQQRPVFLYLHDGMRGRLLGPGRGR